MPLKRAAILSLCLFATSCLSSAVDYDMPEKTDVIPSERVVFLPQQQAWSNITEALAGGFIPVTDMRGSPGDGLLVIDFALADPANFADCGAVTMTYAGHRKAHGTHSEFLKPETFQVYRTSLLGFQRIDVARRSDFKLDGTANVVISPIDARQTLVSVKANYRLNYTHYTQEEGQSSASAEPRSVEFSTHYASDSEPTCYSNGALEISLLDLAESGDARLLRPCVIKGIVQSDGVKVFYEPGHPRYAIVKVAESRGGLWFCSTDQARAAGWIEAAL